MIRRPPRSTLFPTRRSSDLNFVNGQGSGELSTGNSSRLPAWKPARGTGAQVFTGRAAVRSEEHTSELQSQSNLVCRLLLEKKKPQPPKQYSVTPLHHVTARS